jgi:cell division control protein 24
MRKWGKDIDAQRTIQAEQRSARQTATSDSVFTYMRNVGNIQNPYQQEYDAEEELGRETAVFSEFPVSRNASSTSLRARSATGGSGGSGPLSSSRPPRFPMPEPPLSLHTQFSNGGLSPSERNGNSYFSPVNDPPSTRSSSQSAFIYPRQITPTNAWNEDSNRYTAPALSRGTSRDGPNANPYFNNNANGHTQRPSLSGQSQPSNPMMTQRLRSASSPDIHHPHHLGESRRHMNGHTMQTIDNVPVPPIPPHMANMKSPVNRSQDNSPTNNPFPIRPAPQSLGLQHQHAPRQPHPSHEYQPFERSPTSASNQPAPADISFPPPANQDREQPRQLQPPQHQDPYMPTQLKAKVNFDDNYVTLVIASNILFRSLTDRVDAKLARFTHRSIGGKSVRLRYRDEDGDFVTIDSDEAVQLAFMEWRDQHQNTLAQGQVGEIQLFCQAVEN